MPMFTCQDCGRDFSVRDDVLARYDGWTPRQCMSCRGGGSSGVSGRAPNRARSRPPAFRASAREEGLTVAEVLAKYRNGPTEGVFTDGAADPNPGPGGWGAVYVVGDEVVEQAHGHEPHTTNNRMELTALLAGFRLVPAGTPTVVYSDSQYCVKLVNEWAAGWERRGWKRKAGPIANLDLVQELYALARSRPELELKWIKAHDGSRYNEYADALATAYRREVL